MTAADVEIRLAESTDLDGVTALESRYYRSNVDPNRRAEGFISARHSREWFGHAVGEGGLHVAVIDDAVAGFIAVTTPPPAHAPGLSPFTAAMLQLAGELEFNGAPISAQRYGVRGPVCIYEEARGRGIYSAFNAITAQAYQDRFDVGVLFVSTDNHRSLHTATAKLGATPLAVFEVDGRSYHFLAFSFSPTARGA